MPMDGGGRGGDEATRYEVARGVPGPGGAGEEGRFALFPTDGSTWGRVKPHFVQNNAPSLASSPQWRQTDTAGDKVNGVYHRQVHSETPVGRTRDSGPGALPRARGILARAARPDDQPSAGRPDPGPGGGRAHLEFGGAADLPLERPTGRRGRRPSEPGRRGPARPRGRRPDRDDRRRHRPRPPSRVFRPRWSDGPRRGNTRVSRVGRNVREPVAAPFPLPFGPLPGREGRPARAEPDCELAARASPIGGARGRTGHDSAGAPPAARRGRRPHDRSHARPPGPRTAPAHGHPGRDRKPAAAQPGGKRRATDDLPFERASRPPRRDDARRGGGGSDGPTEPFPDGPRSGPPREPL